MSDKSPRPFKTLGEQLRSLRQRVQETLGEVSGAVEIDTKELASFEFGRQRPSEDILLLLISHFGAQEDEATKLWELAGYDLDKIPGSHMVNDDEGQSLPSVMVLPSDVRISYTDMVHVMVNNYGVVINFMQGAGPKQQPLAVARVGMSREHAQSVLEVLQATLQQSEDNSKHLTPKQIAKPETQTPDEQIKS